MGLTHVGDGQVMDIPTARHSFLDLPPEVLHIILVQGGPAALGILSCCCHALRNMIKNNRVLHKELYLLAYV